MSRPKDRVRGRRRSLTRQLDGLGTLAEGVRDVGGRRSDSAVVWINERMHVGCAIYAGDESVLDCIEKVRELATEFQVEEVIFDPFRFIQAALELEQEGIRCVVLPQFDARMCPASDRLYRAVVERRIVLPHHPTLTAHSANAVSKQTPRGWRLERAEPSAKIDDVVAPSMALERCELRSQPVELLGWL